MLLVDIIKNIKAGNFSTILQFPNFFDKIESEKDVEQLFIACSHFVYFEEVISPQNLILLLEFINLCNRNATSKNLCVKLESKFESLFYVLVQGIKKGFSAKQSLDLSEQIEEIITSEKSICLSKKEAIKKIYSSLWKISFQKCAGSPTAFKLQTNALIFLSFSGESLVTISSICLKIGKCRNESNEPLLSDAANMYRRVLSSICHYLNCKPSIQRDSIIALNLMLIEYANVLLKMRCCKEFSGISKPLAVSLESICEIQIVMSFKMSVKIVEAGMALTIGMITIDVFTKMIAMCSIINKMDSIANSILIDSLLQVVNFLEYENTDIPKHQDVVDDLLSPILMTICSRCNSESSTTADTTIKVLQLFGNLLYGYIGKVADKAADYQQVQLHKALYSANLTIQFLETKLDASDKIEPHLYNIGVSSCNLGIYSYKLDNFSVAAEFFDVGVKYLYYCSRVSQKINAMEIIKKKALLLKDSLRLANRFKDAGLKTVHLVLQGIVHHSEIVTTWIKCKRDSIKMGKCDLKTVTIKDIFEEILCKEECSPSEDFVIEDILLQEMEGLQELGLDTIEDEIACAKALIQSATFKHQVEGLICLGRILWTHPTHPQVSLSGSALDSIYKASQLLNNSKGDTNLILEMQARIQFWIFLCKLQVIQQQAEGEIDDVEKETQSLTVHSTDLGEEIQPHDACNIRPSTSVTSFSMQEKTLEPLHESLKLWEEVTKIPSIQSPVSACKTLLSILYIYMFCGLLPSALKAITALLSICQKHDLEKFWIQGMVELLHFAPELVSRKVVERLSSIIELDNFKKAPCSDYHKYEVIAALAFFHYTEGQYAVGAELLNKSLMDPLMERRSIAALEVQVQILYISSMYSLLPKSMLSPQLRITEPCLVLALSATRKAIGLVSTTVEHFSGVFCHNFKVAWIHHKTNMWFGRLCQMTAQPRSARAYVRQALTIAERFAVPLRTAESLSLLAEIDLQCDQLEDCRVKIDSLNSLLQIHGCSTNRKEEIHLITTTMPNKMFKQEVSSKKKRWQELITIHEDTIDESMRETDISPDYKLNLPSINLYDNMVVGEEDRISQLAHPNLLPSSPSFYYREENFTVRTVDCPLGTVDCNVCVTPEIHCIAIRLASMMAMIHTQHDNSRGATMCLRQAEKQLQEFDNLSGKITSQLCSILENVTHTELVYSTADDRRVMFLQSKMLLARLHHFLLSQETACLEHEFDEAHLKNLSTLKYVSELSSNVTTPSLSTIVQLILLGYSIENAVKEERKKQEESFSQSASSSPRLKMSEPNEMFEENFKTPIRIKSNSKTVTARPTPSYTLKPRRNITTDLLNSSLKKTCDPSFSFCIFPDSDNCDSSDKSNVKKSFAKLRPNQKLGVTESKVSRSKVVTKKKVPVTKDSVQSLFNTLESSFDSLTINESSPISEILQVPREEQFNIKNVKPIKTYTCSAAKNNREKLRNSKRLPFVEDVSLSSNVSKINKKDENISPERDSLKKRAPILKENCENTPPKGNSRTRSAKQVPNSLAEINYKNKIVEMSKDASVLESASSRRRPTRAKPSCKKTAK